MKLYGTTTSPFVRRVAIVAAEIGVELERVDTATEAGQAALREVTPIRKVPVAIADGTTLFDSRVISEYLDHAAGGGRIIPAAAPARFLALRLQALCDGVMDACILLVYEGRWRPAERHEPKWIAYQTDKVTRGLAALEADVPGLDATPHVGQIALACMLGYLDLRFGGRWREEHPKLVAWLDTFATRVPTFEATKMAA